MANDTDRSVRPIKKRRTWNIVDVMLALILFGVAFCSVIPLWHVFMASLSNGEGLLAHEGLLWLPVGHASLNGYRLMFSDLGILKGYLNTLIYVVGATAFGLIINTAGGYVLSRESRLRPYLTLFVTFTMLFNGGLIPTYMVIKSLGWVGTRWALIIPGCTNSFFIIMMMNAFRNVPPSTVESAGIDGAGHVRIMFQIMLPQTLSMLTVVVINTVFLQWNSWFPASIYVPAKRDLWPLQLWIKQLVAENVNIFQSANPNYDRWLVQYATIIAGSLPIIIAFPFFQKYLESGMLIGSVKE
ncbi:MAG: carbohydrate ABC transporter permease [Clostridia bacterium]|nr:carbohydrate ABC transporter permease [Clostridia bacterium]